MVEPVDVILLSYNRVDYLQQMVDALERHTQWPYRLTIVDNVSGPETRQWLRDSSERFHQIIWNQRNEHLAGFQRGIAATKSSLFVLSDADLIPHPPTADGCWLTQLLQLADRHPDFGLIGTRLDSISDARNRHLEQASAIDGELIEAPTGVWLNVMRRKALRIPYASDGITSYALRRSGYRVGIAAKVYSTHLGDQDPARHPEYLARKQAASGVGTVYPSYPELRSAGRPPKLEELALAAPVLAALKARHVDPADVVELSLERWPPLASAEPRIESCVKGLRTAAARWSYSAGSPLVPGGAVAVAIVCLEGQQERLLADAFEGAAEWVALLTDDSIPKSLQGWTLEEELPGPHPVIHRLAKVAERRHWRRALGYTTVEDRERWLHLFAFGAYGDTTRLRLYVFHRDEPLDRPVNRWRGTSASDHPDEREMEFARPSMPSSHVPMNRSGRIGAFATKFGRLLWAEWHLLRARR
ncbi:MAG TPA: glycosyltransferase [Solirubrobacteraceae bacterium]|jgi:hypothetical protein